MNYKHKQTGLIATLLTVNYKVGECEVPHNIIENTNDWELIPEHKYQVGDWVKLNCYPGDVRLIIDIKDNKYYFDFSNKGVSESNVKCKVIPIEKTVYLYADRNDRMGTIFASSYDYNYKLIDTQEVTFWEEVKE